MEGDQSSPKAGPRKAKKTDEERDATYARWRRLRDSAERSKIARLRAMRLERNAREGTVEPLETAVDEETKPKRKSKR